jgi:hypothetical protein
MTFLLFCNEPIFLPGKVCNKGHGQFEHSAILIAPSDLNNGSINADEVRVDDPAGGHIGIGSRIG